MAAGEPAPLGIIGGTALERLAGLEAVQTLATDTPWGRPSAPLTRGRLNGAELVFIARHGRAHEIAPHRVNYRANLHALAEAGCEAVLAVASVGGITGAMAPGRLVMPDQLIDYTWGRGHTFFDADFSVEGHIDFTRPYEGPLRERVLAAAQSAGIDILDGGTYAATQGPRLESAAEIRRLERDGCDMVGMTGMPEAALARERGLDYCAVAVVVNWAAGKGAEAITLDAIRRILSERGAAIEALIRALVE